MNLTRTLRDFASYYLSDYSGKMHAYWMDEAECTACHAKGSIAYTVPDPYDEVAFGGRFCKPCGDKIIKIAKGD